MQFDLRDMAPGESHKVLTQVVVPRPIAWVSTRSADGILNLAPFSFFTVATPNPPTLLFSIGATTRDGVPDVKDTLHNIRETGEFVVNIVSEWLATQMNMSSASYPPEVDEFVMSGVTPAPSRVVSVPGVGEAVVHLECRFVQELAVGTSHLVFGEIVAMDVDDTVMTGPYVDPLKLKPLGRLGGPHYTGISALISMPRQP